MINALSIKIDFSADSGRLGYIRYRNGESARTEKLGKSIIVDFDSKSQILAIELFSLDHATLSTACDTVESHDLAFPEFLKTYMNASDALKAPAPNK